MGHPGSIQLRSIRQSVFKSRIPTHDGVAVMNGPPRRYATTFDPLEGFQVEDEAVLYVPFEDSFVGFVDLVE